MGKCISIFEKQFLNKLSIENRVIMIDVSLGDHLSVVSNCGSLVNGIFESYEDGGIFIKINKKSRVLVRGENVDQLKNIK